MTIKKWEDMNMKRFVMLCANIFLFVVRICFLGVGAQISIIGTTEKSVAITGTQDWQKIEMIFNSKDREEVEIGFRLGGYLGQCTGVAWFSDFTFEEGTLSQN